MELNTQTTYGTRRFRHCGLLLWWVCLKVNDRLIPYSDIFAPTGYGFKRRVDAEQKARALEQGETSAP